MDTTAILDSLHPLETKVLSTLKKSNGAQSDAELAKATGLDPSQVSMAVGWLLTKKLLALDTEQITPIVSLSETGKEYHRSASPPEWILQSIQTSQEKGEMITVKDLQSQGQYQPTELSRAIGLLKKDQAIRLASGGSLEKNRNYQLNG